MKKEIEKQLKVLNNLCKKENMTIFLIDNKLANRFKDLMNLENKSENAVDIKDTLTNQTLK